MTSDSVDDENASDSEEPSYCSELTLVRPAGNAGNSGKEFIYPLPNFTFDTGTEAILILLLLS